MCLDSLQGRQPLSFLITTISDEQVLDLWKHPNSSNIRNTLPILESAKVWQMPETGHQTLICCSVSKFSSSIISEREREREREREILKCLPFVPFVPFDQQDHGYNNSQYPVKLFYHSWNKCQILHDGLQGQLTCHWIYILRFNTQILSTTISNKYPINCFVPNNYTCRSLINLSVSQDTNQGSKESLQETTKYIKGHYTDTNCVTLWWCGFEMYAW